MQKLPIILLLFCYIGGTAIKWLLFFGLNILCSGRFMQIRGAKC